MSLKQEIETWVEALDYYDSGEYHKALEIFESTADTSKIFFNIGMIHATLGEHESAVEAYTQAVRLDSFLAVAYFQMGVSNFLLGEFQEAMANFNEALLYLRGNTLIDYEQLGLKFKLFSCEVLFNRGLCYIYDQQMELGMKDLEFAAKEKQVEDHNVIDDAIQEQADGYTVFSVGVGVLYRPNESKVRNVKAKDYLGKARLVAASDAQNAFTGFSGAVVKKTELKQTNATDDRPPNEISFAASNLVRTDLQSRRQSQLNAGSSYTPLSNPVSAKLRNERPSFPPTPPPENEFTPSKPVRANTVAPGMGSRSTGLRNEAQYHDRGGPRDQSRDRGRYDAPEGYGPLRRNQTTHVPSMESRHAYSERSSPRMGAPQQQSRGPPPRGYDPRGPPPREYREDPRLQQQRAPSRGPQTDYLDEIQSNPYADDIHKYGEPRRERDSPRGAPPSQGSQGNVRRGAPGSGSLNRDQQQNRRGPPPAQSRGGRYDEDEQYASDALEGSEFEEDGFEMVKPTRSVRQEIRKIQVKAHLNDEIRRILVPANVEYDDFISRLREKFASRKNLRCKVVDEDGDGMITVSDQEDLDMAISSAKKEARRLGVEHGKIEIWLQEH
ncbi:hypothetical protein EX30DRAFT_340055 [Ascodesmis nigricans]|uniref:PB1 domain-containing protein n=1 Tax=Ascodesmis nigricans TaxID=341454 RepID=A0A4S2MZS6_9PEZI|nr:hypothetical protein EX30DRAFT_340055 [Ascodesmis nigricans]